MNDVLHQNPLEIGMGDSTESFRRLLDSQREIFRSQVDQMQNIVVTQCKLTGINPLSQEMAAGALSVKIGKRPRDLLNPKAVKYMQSIFSIKDAVSKKESREISTLFGVTATQVRDFFSAHRSRVRKFVRLSREMSVIKEQQDGPPVNLDTTIPILPVPLKCVGPSNTEEPPTCSEVDEDIPSLNDSEKYFLDNIFNLMRKEETFSGQVKLMEWILKMQHPSILCWFLTKGGVMILATWLSQAAVEEQTSVLFLILKVLCHLPLHKALPESMSAILQSVNRLRFYRTSDISNRARVLLSKWSKIFARSQALKKPTARIPSGVHTELSLKQSIGEIMGDDLWQSRSNFSEVSLIPFNGSENFRKLEPPHTMKLLPASAEDSKKNIRGACLTKRKKVQLLEFSGQKTLGRSSQGIRAVPLSQGRPMSADDILKSKMRALFMQSKYGKVDSSSSGNHQVKTETLNKPSSSQNSNLSPESIGIVHLKNEETEKSPVVHSKISDPPEVILLDPKQNLDPKESIREKCKRVQIQWHTPPEMRINALWGIGYGENSKEVEVQKNRIHRELEIIYQTFDDIPPEPRGPWDIEMDFDDTLTPDIPTEQPPDCDIEQSISDHEIKNDIVIAPTESSSQLSHSNIEEPDLELLAVLLKNPDVVFSLIHGNGLSSQDTVKLLDMIKSGKVCLPGSSNSNIFNGKVEERIETSLPSPTPSSNPTTSGWKSEVAKNPFSQQYRMPNNPLYTSPETTSLATTPSFEIPPPQFSTISSFLQKPPRVPTMHQTNPRVVNSHNPELFARNLVHYSNQIQQPEMNYNSTRQFGKPSHTESRRGVHGYNRCQANEYGHYNSAATGSGPQWERNDYETDYETDYNLNRSPPAYGSERNIYAQPRMNSSRFNSYSESRQRNDSEYRGQNRNGNRWYDRIRRR